MILQGAQSRRQRTHRVARLMRGGRSMSRLKACRTVLMPVQMPLKMQLIRELKRLRNLRTILSGEQQWLLIVLKPTSRKLAVSLLEQPQQPGLRIFSREAAFKSPPCTVAQLIGSQLRCIHFQSKLSALWAALKAMNKSFCY